MKPIDDEYWAGLPHALSVRQVSATLRVSDDSIWRRLKAQKLPAYRIAGSWIIFRDELRQWIECNSNQRDHTEPVEPVDVLQQFGDELTFEDLMRIFGKTKQTVYRWLNDGVIPAYSNGGRWTIYTGDLREALAAERVGPAIGARSTPPSTTV